MRVTEGNIRSLIRRILSERIGLPLDGSPEMELLRSSFSDPGLKPEDVRHLAYKQNFGRVESVEIIDSVVHAYHPPVRIDSAAARAAGTSLPALVDALAALGASRIR